MRALAVRTQRCRHIQRRALATEAACAQLVPVNLATLGRRRGQPRAIQRGSVAFAASTFGGHRFDQRIGGRVIGGERVRCGIAVAPALEPLAQVARPRHAGVEAGRGRGQRRHRVLQRGQRIGQHVEAVGHRRQGQGTVAGAARRQRFHRHAQFAQRLLQRAHRRLHHRQRTGGLLAFGQAVAAQLLQLATAEAFAEEARRQLRQLVRLVDHERLRAGSASPWP
ncbi:MAG: hypothetical protein J7507_11075, partial [Pseudoxanthomonas sp.]|nr:hypothetical protein [Pseudoxanthomonas sp.]